MRRHNLLRTRRRRGVSASCRTLACQLPEVIGGTARVYRASVGSVAVTHRSRYQPHLSSSCLAPAELRCRKRQGTSTTPVLDNHSAQMRCQWWFLWLQTLHVSLTTAIGVPQRNGESHHHVLSTRVVSTISACGSDTISVPLSVKKCINILTGLEVSILNIGLGINILCTTRIETVNFDTS